MFRVFRLKTIVIIGLILLIVMGMSIGIVGVVKTKEIPKPKYKIVVDAGHGGRDNGCTGVGGTIESDINLKIANTLKQYLETLGIEVVMTRLDNNGLYKSNVDNYKQSDMEERLKIINKEKPNMVISIHQNSFSDSTQRGAQAFYQEGDETSLSFATCVQSQLKTQLINARNECNYGDYYILKESNLPAILIECGYLTNPDEELLLNTTQYQNKVAYSIMCGVVKYFNLCGND